MATELPPWVYDMVMHLERWHDEHGQLFVNAFNASLGRHEYVKADSCGCGALDAVPAETRANAKALRSYLAAKEKPDGD